ncbi:D-alanyl-D-alanine carboxypeptidase family protein [Jeotgalibacillus sp. HH7-29]|uniref:serine-type D-Ala-D-Ala carboxypeptidase n=1 Tax=Jeotgalibacillus haloalkalitolerans TaxID=3104292 RepID=A0ABU5KLP6_9BACL|nr:D-alanyl-D-alanine carboxypeptidase family protein [Jeotgalibacillus sp. HH7-29]MDZ5712064.1 D-alanyl-D-alanine carboxypeptidase family protein [Jeotgalibacillus sp. HH7-29]
MKKLLFLLCISLFFCINAQSDAAELNLGKVKSGILVDADTGMVLYEQNSNDQLPPASMTKIGTLLLIMEEIDQGRLSWEDEVVTSSTAAGMGGSQIYLKQGEKMTVKEMVKAISIASANDASVAMAEHISGSEESFVKKLNDRIGLMGLKDTQFKNVTGLPESGHFSSAHDMSMLAKELLRHEEITEFTGTYDDYLRQDTDPFWLVNTNKMIKSYPGADGLKTGYTSEAKYCLTATAKRGEMRLITVIFGAESSKERNQLSAEMLNYGFTNFVSKTFNQKGEVLAEAAINKGTPEKVEAALSNSLKVIEKKNENAVYKRKVVIEKNLQAPLEKGEIVGYVSVFKGDKAISKGLLESKNDTKKANWSELFKRSWKKSFFAN